MSWEQQAITTISAILALLVAHHLGRRRNREDELQKVRLQAYVDYIGAAMRMALAKRQKDEDAYRKELPAYNDAKARICLCAPAAVVRQMINFHKTGADLEQQQRILAMRSLCYAIRDSLIPWSKFKDRWFRRLATLGLLRWDNPPADTVLHLNLSQVLFDLEPGTLPHGYRTDIFEPLYSDHSP